MNHPLFMPLLDALQQLADQGLTVDSVSISWHDVSTVNGPRFVIRRCDVSLNAKGSSGKE